MQHACSIATLTEPGCEVFLQSDIFGVVAEMRDMFRKNPAFEDTRKSWAVEDEEEWEQWEWMTGDDPNPTGIKTEREISVENRDLPVWRALLVRK